MKKINVRKPTTDMNMLFCDFAVLRSESIGFARNSRDYWDLG